MWDNLTRARVEIQIGGAIERPTTALQLAFGAPATSAAQASTTPWWDLLNLAKSTRVRSLGGVPVDLHPTHALAPFPARA